MRDELNATITDADHLLATFRALLRIARIESGTHDEAWTDIDLGALLHDAWELYHAVGEEKEITVHLGAAVGHMRGDRDLIFQAVSNLLDNAIKYSPADSEVRLEMSDEDGLLTIIVSDQGPGVPAAERGKVLDRFYRTATVTGIPAADSDCRWSMPSHSTTAVSWYWPTMHPGCASCYSCPGPTPTAPARSLTPASLRCTPRASLPGASHGQFPVSRTHRCRGAVAGRGFADGISFDSGTWLLASAIVLGVINAFVRPLVMILTLPFTIITLGFFVLHTEWCHAGAGRLPVTAFTSTASSAFWGALSSAW